MAHPLLVTRPQEFVDRAKASAVVKEVQAEVEAKERRKLERKSTNTFSTECLRGEVRSEA
jgi:hypothetical protein